MSVIIRHFPIKLFPVITAGKFFKVSWAFSKQDTWFIYVCVMEIVSLDILK